MKGFMVLVCVALLQALRAHGDDTMQNIVNSLLEVNDAYANGLTSIPYPESDIDEYVNPESPFDEGIYDPSTQPLPRPTRNPFKRTRDPSRRTRTPSLEESVLRLRPRPRPPLPLLPASLPFKVPSYLPSFPSLPYYPPPFAWNSPLGYRYAVPYF